MTTQQIVLETLLNGGYISQLGKYRARVLDRKASPVRAINSRTLARIDRLLRRDPRRGYLVLDLREVRRLNGNSWIKKLYKQRYEENKQADRLAAPLAPPIS